MLQFVLLAMTLNKNVRQITPAQWLPMSLAIAGMACAAALLVS